MEMTRKDDSIVYAWGELCLPAIIIIPSTNVEVIIQMRNCGLKEKQEVKPQDIVTFGKKNEAKIERKAGDFSPVFSPFHRW